MKQQPLLSGEQKKVYFMYMKLSVFVLLVDEAALKNTIYLLCKRSAIWVAINIKNVFAWNPIHTEFGEL